MLGELQTYLENFSGGYFKKPEPPPSQTVEALKTGVKVLTNVAQAATPILIPEHAYEINLMIDSLSKAILLDPKEEEGRALAKATGLILNFANKHRDDLRGVEDRIANFAVNHFDITAFV